VESFRFGLTPLAVRLEQRGTAIPPGAGEHTYSTLPVRESIRVKLNDIIFIYTYTTCGNG